MSGVAMVVCVYQILIVQCPSTTISTEETSWERFQLPPRVLSECVWLLSTWDAYRKAVSDVSELWR